MITANVIHRVFQMRCGASVASCFTIDVDGKQYVVTASHVLSNWDGTSPLDVRYRGAWLPVDWKLTGHASSGVDVSVLAPSIPLSPSHSMPPTNKDITYGQEVFFLGFPYLMTGLPYGVNERIDATNRHFPMPLVKHAVLSGWGSIGDAEVLLLDGHNNPGFSGGPVVFRPAGSLEFRVAGVVSAYHSRRYPVFDGATPTKFTYEYNTGIIVASSIYAATTIIQANSNGAPIS